MVDGWTKREYVMLGSEGLKVVAESKQQPVSETTLGNYSRIQGSRNRLRALLLLPSAPSLLPRAPPSLRSIYNLPWHLLQLPSSAFSAQQDPSVFEIDDFIQTKLI